jgi:hypothetical protein
VTETEVEPGSETAFEPRPGPVTGTEAQMAQEPRVQKEAPQDPPFMTGQVRAGPYAFSFSAGPDGVIRQATMHSDLQDTGSPQALMFMSMFLKALCNASMILSDLDLAFLRDYTASRTQAEETPDETVP